MIQQTIQIPDNVPVSWLQHLEKLTPDVLMLASEPNNDTETRYMSKYFTYQVLRDTLCSDLSVFEIWDALSDKLELSNYLTGELQLNINDPYIISSIDRVAMLSNGQPVFGILSIDGYRLSTGMQNVFCNYHNTNTDISVLAPQLGPNWTYIPDEHVGKTYISSVFDVNGHVREFGLASLSDAMAVNIPSATICCDPGYCVSSVTTEGGCVTGVGQAKLGSSFYYKDYSELEHADDQFDLCDLYIMKLKLSQLRELSSAGKVRPDCIYLTIDDVDPKPESYDLTIDCIPAEGGNASKQLR